MSEPRLDSRSAERDRLRGLSARHARPAGHEMRAATADHGVGCAEEVA